MRVQAPPPQPWLKATSRMVRRSGAQPLKPAPRIDALREPLHGVPLTLGAHQTHLPRVGVEPTAYRVSTCRSTSELPKR